MRARTASSPSFPISLLLLVSVVPLFLVQLVPILGIVLMMLAAPYWPVLLINGGMIGVALEVWKRGLSPAWLCLPALWFGGYLAAAGYSHVRAVLADREITQANAGQSVAFSHSGQSLVLIDENEFDEADAAQIARDLVLDHGLEPVFARNTNFAPQHLAYRREPDPCEGDRSPGCRYRREPHRNAYHTPERPTRGVVTVRVGSAAGTFDDNEVRVPLRVTDGGGRTVRLMSGLIRPLSWWPQPIVGCGLAQGSRWQCGAQFGRDHPRGLGGVYAQGGSATAVIATAIRLDRAKN